MKSIRDLGTCAHAHLAHYYNPSGGRAFHAYDRIGSVDSFEPLDALAPGLLDAPVRGSIVIDMFSEADSPYSRLRQAMDRLLAETAQQEPSFEELDLSDESGPWQLVREVLCCSDEAPGLAASKVTKMLHRKRPNFVPIFDSKVAAFYGSSRSRPWTFWPLLQADLQQSRSMLEGLCHSQNTPDGRPLSRLRAADIVIWEHQVTQCAQ